MRLASRTVVVITLLLTALTALAEEVTFRFQPPEGVEPASVTLRGSFNDWGETPMERQDDGSWSVTIELEPGAHAYKYFIDGEWPQDLSDWRGLGPLDPDADAYADDGFGGMNAVRVIAEAALPAGEARALDAAQVRHRIDDPAHRDLVDGRLVLRFEAGRDQIARATVETDIGSEPMTRQLWWGNREVWRVALGAQVTNYRFVLEGHDGSAAVIDQDGEPFTFNGQDPLLAVDWVRDQVFYQIFPDRFANGNPLNDQMPLRTDESVYNTAGTVYGGPPQLSEWSDPPGPSLCCHQYFGGDLAGVLDRLDYLTDLGVTAIYFNPIFEAGSAHGYDTHDYLRIQPHLGTEALFRQLLETAHRHGMRVILDFVPNHTGLGHWAFQDVLANGPDSDYWDWYFVRQWPFEAGDTEAYVYWASAPSLPKLNTQNPEVRAHLLEVVRYWLELGIDGWRVDVPNEVLGADTFFREMREVVKAVDPEAYILGEIWETDPSWVQGDRFDSLMNYPAGREVIVRFARGDDNPLTTPARMQSDLARIYGAYSEDVAAMSFNVMGTHDTARVLTQLGGGDFGDEPTEESLARLRLASTVLYSLPGAPVTFQGDECGLLGQQAAVGTQDLHRYPIQWEACDPDLQAHYQSLAVMRAELPALRSPVFRSFATDAQVLGFYRGEPSTTGEVLVLANNSLEERSVTLPSGSWRAVGRPGLLRGGAEVTVPALGVTLLERL